jgi:hypothetical protein
LLGRVLIWWSSKYNLSSVPDQCDVIRLGRLPKDFQEKGQISAIQVNGDLFNLSSLDKEATPPHLSVWVSALTSAEQAYSFLPEGSQYKLLLRLNVEEIRRVVGNTGQALYPHLLNVIWVHLVQEIDGQRSRDRRGGAIGHAGITGLDDKSMPSELTDKQQKKNLRKDLRSKLAEIASKDASLRIEQ